MKVLNLTEMEGLLGGWEWNRSSATGFMCGLAATLLCTGVFAPIAAAPGIGCAIGAYAILK